MNVGRSAARIILAVSFALSIAVVIFALTAATPISDGAWATIAAALAVVASVVAAWTSQKSFELQQDAQLPYPYPSVDGRSRYGLLQLCVTNTGGTAAHNIRITWDKPLLNSKGERIVFTKQDGAPDIAVLLPGQRASKLIDGSAQFFPAVTNADYSGVIEFEDGSGRRLKHRFQISIEDLRGSLYHDQEEPKALFELQKIPGKIEELARELGGIRHQLESQRKEDINE